MYESGDAVLGSIIVKEVDSVNDMTHLCRLCAKCCDSLIPIFHGEGVENDIPMKIKKYLPIEVTETDKLPLQLCLNCCHTLTTWHEFISCCIKADENLKTLKQKTSEHVKEAVCLEQSELKINEAVNTSNGDNMHESSVQQTVCGQNSEISETSREKDDGLIQEFPLSSRYSSLFPLQGLNTEQDVKSEKCIIPDLGKFVVYNKCSVQGLENGGMCKSNGDKPVYQCDYCGKVLASRDSIIVHLRVHSGECPYNCTICGKRFRARSGIRRHLKEVHKGIKDQYCLTCGRAFANKRTLEDHIRIHSGERPYICDSCGKSFRTSASLYVHKRSHQELNPFRCSFCERNFRTQHSLSRHIMQHTGEKPHACENCGKRFYIRGDLQNHKPVHSEERPYSCTNCSLVFKTRKYLYNHIRNLSCRFKKSVANENPSFIQDYVLS